MEAYQYMKKKRPVLVAVILVLIFSVVLGFSACAAEADSKEESGKIQLTATTTMLSDLARNIAGEEVEVTGLMGTGIDPHLYQASAGDISALQEADVVLYNGIHLEGKMGDIFASLREQNKTVISVEDALDKNDLIQTEDSEQNYDPHVWFNVELWKKAARHLAQELSAYAPEHKAVFKTNLESYVKELEDLEKFIQEKVDTLPKDKRILVTAHDAFSYFGKAYGFEVKGLQGISTETEAGTQDISQMAEYIANNEIKAVFVESSVSPKTIEALQAAVKSKGFETAIGGSLYSDSLGDKESGDDSYIETWKANIETIVSALQ
ncbi:metal ABC transporter solute-binding protein, Zn/Mn family [Scatolibacter rhodanostii]|uniref:metal ABC transporter solute-binding protein, Zn/Mn family n=1 Tax=Scatolibacter rhodanostii TaxID=2014781 RepID=UPI001FA8D284|nr:zinc ABC transporter substrate-binding protein [Scatolibacter rhodanostii]